MKIKTNPNRFKALLAVAGLTLLTAISSQATDRFWTAGTATWNSGANWTPGATIPVGGDNAIVNNGGTVVISAGDPTWTPFDFRAGQGGGNGAYRMDGGTVALNSWFRMGVDTGTTGTFTMNGGSLTANPAFKVGENGVGILIINGGTISHGNSGDPVIFGDGDRGNSATSTGYCYHTNGTLTSAGEVWIGEGSGQGSAHGYYNMDGTAVLNFNNWFTVGRGGAIGLLNMTNGSINKTGGSGSSFIVGANATGTINQYGGTISNTVSETWIAEGVGTGIWNLLGGTAIVGTLNCAQGGTATLNLGGTGVLIAKEIKPNGGSGTINFNGGTLQAGASTTTLFHDVGSVLVNSNVNLNTAGFNVTVAQVFSDGGFGGGLVKSGAGTAKLTGANNYSGPNTVTAGKLQVSTASSASGSVSVSNGAGYGVIVASANAQLSSASVTFGTSAATTSDFDLGNFGNPTAAPMNVTGNLAVNGTVTVNIADAFPQVGQFPLISYATKSGSGSFVIGSLPVGVSATIVNNVGNNSIDLNITSTSLIRWDGQVAGGVWDINTTTNWTDYVTTAAAKFITGSAVFFDDVALGTTAINLGVAVSPGSVVFTNDALAYSITGNGSINGTTSLIKTGTNSLTIGTTNSYTGATTISGGTVSINKLANGGSPSSVGSSSSSSANLVLNGGTLSYTGPAVSTDRGFSVTANTTLNVQNDIAVSGAVVSSGGASLTKTGNGLLTYKNQSANTLSSGGYYIQNGTVVVDNSTNNIGGEIWPGAGASSTGGNLIVTNSTLNVSSWLAIARGTGTGGYSSSLTAYNSKMTSGNMSLCYDNGIAGTLQSGSLTLNGNTTYTNNGDSNLGESSGGLATITLNDSSVFYGNNRMMVGWHTGATGAVVVANSAKVVVNAWMSIGNEGGVGSVLVKDSGSLQCGDFNVCDVNTGTGSFYARDNAAIHAGNMWVGKGDGSVGYLLVSNNATILSDNGITLGQGVSSTANVDLAGNSSLSVNLVQGFTDRGSSSTFNFNGGTLIAHSPYFGNDFIYSLQAANVMQGGAKIQINGTDSRNVSQALLDGDGLGGGLTKLGTGSLLLDGANTYTGATTVSAGTLGGSGSVAGNVTVSASTTLAPGDGGIGTFTIGGNLNLSGTLAVDVNKTNSPATNDLVALSGTLSGSGTVSVSNQGSALTIGDSFTIFSHAVSGLSVPPSAGVVWNNNLSVNGSISVASFIAPPAFATSNPVVASPGGSATINATGVVGASYTLRATTDLTLPIASWTVISSGTVTTSPFSIVDTGASSLTKRFYIFSTP